MSNTILSGNTVTADVTFVIDVEKIRQSVMQGHPAISMDPLNPTTINSGVYIATYTPKDGLKVTSSSGANITVPISSNIRWRATTVSNNFDYSIVLYKFQKLSSGHDIISIPSQIWSQRPGGKEVPVIPSGVNANEDAPKLDFVELNDSYFQAIALNRGSEQYTWWFAAYDGRNLLGYFRYDPYVEVTNS
ncbi:AidA/PixA family protein [Photorhabdus bodei]|uniref:Inclusion body protein n=1 Tax=Photorhabdus bodei TaxID=2029681 RepID=A0A329X0W1_9GAMM|nr:AidA/PixA family protein [Photorhabdus bodei]NDK98728.1 hypothetical protein [Photorhabdus bodei]NDL03676.1 hypothetical protein [Photorhabdus bodei]NDL07186.1 hypothetical protein [Photorhabdus bodei]RAX10381.1 hypothetical protein CKY02_15115 [Photorhabdus bodei]